MSTGYFVFGAIVGAVLISAESNLESFDARKVFAKSATASSSADINRQFAATGKGLIAAPVGDKICVIDARYGLGGTHLNFMTCTP